MNILYECQLILFYLRTLSKQENRSALSQYLYRRKQHDILSLRESENESNVNINQYVDLRRILTPQVGVEGKFKYF